MSEHQVNRDTRAARGLVRLYPPSWRDRYGAEMLALLADTGVSTRTTLNVVGGAAGAWLRPRGHLLERDARIRASIAATLGAWVAITAALLVYAQLFADQTRLPDTSPGHPFTIAMWRACQIAGGVSVAVLVLGGAPLAVQLLRDAAGRRSARDLVLLTLPVTASGAFLLVLYAIARTAGHPGNGVAPGWFIALCVLGVLAGAADVAGPMRVLRRQAAHGKSLRRAAQAAAAAGLILLIAASAALANLIAIHRWTTPAATVHAPIAVIATFGAVVLLATAVGGTSAIRALRAVRTHS
jgi:hypothetical protein